MQLLMTRQGGGGERPRRQLYCDAHSAFYECDGGSDCRGCIEGSEGKHKGVNVTRRPRRRRCTF